MPTLTLLMLLVAQGPAPTIDGRIDPLEWATATKHALAGGGELYVLPQGEFLYVGVRGPRAGLASLCIMSGGRVRILHASAAIGDAVYDREGGEWVKRSDFTWSLRDTPRGAPITEQERDAYLAHAGWLANASAAGSADREFQIRRSDVDRIAVTYLSTGDPLTVSYWPESVDDDCRDVKVPQGYLSVTARFRPDRWYRPLR